jgi:dipeptidyl aminopeptidase/acylaminoacyl peptidase
VGGARHYGAIIAPEEARPGSVPVLVYAHGGDAGASVEEAIFLSASLGALGGRFVWVVPSFRSETLRAGSSSWTSEGPASPWDRDVDDALALLNVALAMVPEADGARIGLIGFSRGACVALLMGVRDPRIDRIVEFFGPTDFFGAFAQEVVEDALLGELRDLPGLAYLDSEFIQPLKQGELTISDVRPELVRRSPVYWAELLPALQLHHGTADTVVPVGEAERLIEVLEGLGRGAPDFQFYLYTGGVHNPLTLAGSIARTQDFLSQLVNAPHAAR